MKKTILLLSLALISILSFGQSKEAQKNIDKVVFYGVDYSKAKLIRVPESPGELKSAFLRINDLFYSEPKKFDIEKHLKKIAKRTTVEAVKERIEDMDEEEMKTSDLSYALDSTTIKEMIKTLPTKETEGVGLIMICEKINKDQNRGYYHIAYFDIATREIIDTWRASGKAAGFGVRNFWATSVIKAMRDKKPR